MCTNGSQHITSEGNRFVGKAKTWTCSHIHTLTLGHQTGILCMTGFIKKTRSALKRDYTALKLSQTKSHQEQRLSSQLRAASLSKDKKKKKNNYKCFGVAMYRSLSAYHNSTKLGHKCRSTRNI